MSVIVTDAQYRPILAVIRSLGRHNIEVTASSPKKLAMSFFSKYCKQHFLYPNPEKKPHAFLDTLLNIVKKKKYDVLFSGSSTMKLISRFRDKFASYVHVPLAAHEKIMIAENKWHVIKIAMEHGIPCPKTTLIRNIQEIDDISKKIEYPVVIKPQVGIGAKGVEYAHSPSEFVRKYKMVYSRYGSPLIQEYIPGTGYGVSALFNKYSEPRAVFMHRRIRENPITGGASTLRESILNPEMEKLGLKLLKALGWYGVAMVEFKLDSRDKKPKLMEINPRFWGSLQLAIASGVDFPYLLYKMEIEGDVKPVNSYKVGVKCRHLFRDISIARQYVLGSKNKLARLFDFLKFFEPNLHYDVMSFRDPGPAFCELTNLIINTIAYS